MDLPPELRALDAQLAGRPKPDLPAALRARVLEAVRAELAREPRVERISFWRFAAGMAAAALLWINLSMSAANDTVWHWNGAKTRIVDAAALQQIQEVMPECSETEARARLLLLCAGELLVATPRPLRPTSARESTEF
jgi:hypothetical protein